VNTVQNKRNKVARVSGVAEESTLILCAVAGDSANCKGSVIAAERATNS